jgi:hypothetical protein
MFKLSEQLVLPDVSHSTRNLQGSPALTLAEQKRSTHSEKNSVLYHRAKPLLTDVTLFLTLRLTPSVQPVCSRSSSFI